MFNDAIHNTSDSTSSLLKWLQRSFSSGWFRWCSVFISHQERLATVMQTVTVTAEELRHGTSAESDLRQTVSVCNCNYTETAVCLTEGLVMGNLESSEESWHRFINTLKFLIVTLRTEMGWPVMWFTIYGLYLQISNHLLFTGQPRLLKES